MTGRIKLYLNGTAVNTQNLPEIDYTYDEPGDFDKTCGTFGLDDFQLPNQYCPDRFVCDKSSGSEELQQFSECIEAMNCNMLHGMTTGISG